jgi:hypothetical protein
MDDHTRHAPGLADGENLIRAIADRLRTDFVPAMLTSQGSSCVWKKHACGQGSGSWPAVKRRFPTSVITLIMRLLMNPSS